MSRSFIAVAGALLAFAGTVAAQVVTVVGTGDPSVDVPAVQAAVDQGGRVVLKGHFSFDAPPTVAELASVLFSAAPLGMVLISKPVEISGTRDDQGEMATIEGGANPFYVDAPASHVTIHGLHFMHPEGCCHPGSCSEQSGDRLQPNRRAKARYQPCQRNSYRYYSGTPKCRRWATGKYLRDAMDCK